jgi:hypothetical protein
MYAKIQQVSTFPLPSVILGIASATVQPGAHASVSWWLQSEDGATQATGSMTLDGAAYAAWGADDAYLYNYAAQQLGLVIVEIVPDVAPVVTAPDEVVTAQDLPSVAQDVAPVVSDEAPAAGGNND